MTEALTARGLTLDGMSLTPRNVAAAARTGGADVRLSEAAKERMRAALPARSGGSYLPGQEGRHEIARAQIS